MNLSSSWCLDLQNRKQWDPSEIYMFILVARHPSASQGQAIGNCLNRKGHGVYVRSLCDINRIAKSARSRWPGDKTYYLLIHSRKTRLQFLYTFFSNEKRGCVCLCTLDGFRSFGRAPKINDRPGTEEATVKQNPFLSGWWKGLRIPVQNWVKSWRGSVISW